VSAQPGRVVVVMGASGSGKSTVGALLAGRTGAAFVDADDLHPTANVAKMAAGVPLTDDDRLPWLAAVAAAAEARASTGQDVVVACSALRASYRDRLRAIAAPVTFVFLSAPREVLAARLAARVGHFMKGAMLDSQLAALEAPAADDGVIIVDAAAATADDITTALAARLTTTV
jgi:gluconokinase